MKGKDADCKIEWQQGGDTIESKWTQKKRLASVTASVNKVVRYTTNKSKRLVAAAEDEYERRRQLKSICIKTGCDRYTRRRTNEKSETKRDGLETIERSESNVDKQTKEEESQRTNEMRKTHAKRIGKEARCKN